MTKFGKPRKNRNLDDDACWQIVCAKDRRFDGQFLTGVHSTGIYCRPSCPARMPKRENVRFYENCNAAQDAGLRACKRCAPDQQSREEGAIRDAITAIKAAEVAPSLNDLGKLTGYSPTHFQRIFKRATGLSPAAYARALREDRVKDALLSEDSVTDAIYKAGYSAPSRFYDGINIAMNHNKSGQSKLGQSKLGQSKLGQSKLGMSASDWSSGGKGRVIHWAQMPTSMGDMLVAATDKGVCCLAFNEGEAELLARFPNADLIEGCDDFRNLFAQVLDAVEEPGTGRDIPLDVKGTAFQQSVWQALLDIPAGETRSYGELAASLGNPKASRAVGGANGANNIAVLIPCHRVIAAGGGLGGYAYGTKIKTELLKREGVETDPDDKEPVLL